MKVETLNYFSENVVIWEKGSDLERCLRQVLSETFQRDRVAVYLPLSPGDVHYFISELVQMYDKAFSRFAYGYTPIYWRLFPLPSGCHFDVVCLHERHGRGIKSLLVTNNIEQFRGSVFATIFTIGDNYVRLRTEFFGRKTGQLGTGVAHEVQACSAAS